MEMPRREKLKRAKEKKREGNEREWERMTCKSYCEGVWVFVCVPVCACVCACVCVCVYDIMGSRCLDDCGEITLYTFQ